jgi:hypothetical protein
MSIQTTLLTATKTFFSIKPKRDSRISRNTAIVAAIAVVLTQIGDFSTTVYGLSFGANEANGLMAQFIQEQGYLSFLALKLGAAGFLAWVTWKRRYAPWVITALYTAVILSNLYVISKLV